MGGFIRPRQPENARNLLWPAWHSGIAAGSQTRSKHPRTQCGKLENPQPFGFFQKCQKICKNETS